jgi:DNA-3-methyladenine glycosylase II
MAGDNDGQARYDRHCSHKRWRRLPVPSASERHYHEAVAFPHPPAAAELALKALVREHPDLASILERAGPLPWRTRTAGFPGLLQAIVAQMISNQAAAAIWGRLRALPGALQPDGLLALTDDDLRGAGLSRPKVAHARILAEAFRNGLLSAAALEVMGNDEAIAMIASVKGLGTWTAEIYLLFALQRLDVFPAGDIALAASAAELKGLDVRPNPKVLRALAETWRPARSLAARLLWHHWRYLTGRPALDDFPV